jgi:hypothetical protein
MSFRDSLAFSEGGRVETFVKLVEGEFATVMGISLVGSLGWVLITKGASVARGADLGSFKD